MWLVAAAATVVLLVECDPVRAQIFYSWDNPSGGSYNTSGNWFPFGVPNDNTEGAGFDLNATYTVSFPTSVTTSEAYVSSGNVSFDLDTSGTPRVYSIATLTVNGSGSPWLYVDDGTVSATSSTILGGTAGLGGLMTIRAGGTVTTPTATIGDAGSGYMVLQNFHETIRQDGIFNSSTATLGKAATGNGQAEVFGVWNTGDLTVGDAGDGFLNILASTTITSVAHTNGGRVYSPTASIAAQSGSEGSVYLQGMTYLTTSDVAYWNVAEELYVGGVFASPGGTAYLTVDDLGWADVDGFMHVHPEGEVVVRDGGTLSVGIGMSLDGGSLLIESGGTLDLAPDGGINPVNGANVTVEDLYLLRNDSFFKVGDGGTMDFPSGLNIGSVSSGGMMIDDPGTNLSAGDCVWGNNHGGASVFLFDEATLDTGDLLLANSPSSGTSASVSVFDEADMTVNGILRLAQLGGSTTTAFLSVEDPGSSFTQNDSSATSIVVGNATGDEALIEVALGATFTTGTGETLVRTTGEIRLDSGAVFDARGPIHMDGGEFNFLGGTLHFDDFVGSLENQGGSLAPGHSAGIATITEDYTQQPAASLAIEIGGSDNSDILNPEYDVLEVGGIATLDGLVNVSLLDGFLPTVGQQFTVLTSDDIVDNDLELGGPAANFFTMLVGGTSVVLEAVGMDGDYNGNYVIDAADYTVWRDALTAGSSVLLNDPTPGIVNESDFTYWRAHFGETLGGGAGSAAHLALGESPGANYAVPEPTSGVLMIVVGLVGSWFRRQTR